MSKEAERLENLEELANNAIDAIIELGSEGYEEQPRAALATVNSIRSDIWIKQEEFDCPELLDIDPDDYETCCPKCGNQIAADESECGFCN